ncbi:helix-turn-helix transcriptional regulator [Leptolyngbya sp. AN03gr2]|uniref:helix-turn-helix transcriptional regulator n=1 Tax=unclassified Leptolyngbya TaxID=2650499 RepID=UPI003D3134C2
MAIILSRTDYDALWKAQNPTPASHLSNDSEQIQTVPDQLGQGWMQSIQLRGIDLCIFNYQLHEDLTVQQQSFGTEWEFGFNLSGNRSGNHSGENFIAWGTYEDSEDWVTYANNPILKIDIHLETPDELSRWVTESLEDLPIEIRQWIEDPATRRFDDTNMITPAMRSTLEQILYCPFEGATKRIYLESKCLELIALKLEQIKNTKTAITHSDLKPDDLDRICQAAQVLKDNLENPPSLIELAHQVNLNDYKLKIGFRQVFGTTVFGYLHQHRMEAAQQLLSDRVMNVKEVAQAVGYKNQSRFAAAFRKQFGINPKSYLLNQRSV